MKINHLMSALILGSSLLTLPGCSYLHKNTDDAAVTDATATSDGAQSSGVGEASGFANEGDMTPQQLLEKRTYYFDFDRSEIHEADKAALFANAEHLVANPDQKILLEGHTDPRGSREYNVALGEHRANSVAELLKTKGVNPTQIRVISYGAERLAATGRSEEDYAQDRRVVLVYLQ